MSDFMDHEVVLDYHNLENFILYNNNVRQT